MGRKIVQIAVTYSRRNKEWATEPDDRLFALCDDGSVWIYVWESEPGPSEYTPVRPEGWVRLIDIPQD